MTAGGCVGRGKLGRANAAVFAEVANKQLRHRRLHMAAVTTRRVTWPVGMTLQSDYIRHHTVCATVL